jgi:hypothetical protein
VEHEDGGLYIPGFGWHGGHQIAVHTDRCPEIGSGACQLQDIAATKTEAHGGDARPITDTAFVRLLDHCHRDERLTGLSTWDERPDRHPTRTGRHLTTL